MAVEPLETDVPPAPARRPRRGRTLRNGRLTQAVREALARGRAAYPPIADADRACPEPDADGVRRCWRLACGYNRVLDVDPSSGTIRFNVSPADEPSDEADGVPWIDLAAERQSTCALDLAERGGMTLDEVARATGLVRERVRQLEARALDRLARAIAGYGLSLAALCAETPGEGPWERAQARAPG